ncbi:MAG: hypothetical protein ACKO23_10710, partial [Gemmataceae bacterium]
MSFLHRTPLWLVLIGLMAVLVVPAPGQDPNIPPFDRQNPPGDPPPVPEFGDQPGAMDQQPAQGNANQPEVLGKGPVHEA